MPIFSGEGQGLGVAISGHRRISLHNPRACLNMAGQMAAVDQKHKFEVTAMKRETTFSFDGDENHDLSMKRIEEICNLLQGHMLDEEKSLKSPAPGVRALRKMRGNQFSESDLLTFQNYVRTLLERGQEKLNDLEVERSEIAKDHASVKHYDFLVETVTAALNDARQKMADFIGAFNEEFLDEEFLVEDDVDGRLSFNMAKSPQP